MRASSLVLFTLFLAGCSATTPPKCDATTCIGCCDSSGSCQTGDQRTACGVGGASCDTCVGNQECLFGDCSGSTGGGAGGGTGGGTGGGSGGGGGSGRCSGSLTECGTTCVDLLSSADHCGRCSSACTAGKVCNRGACEPLPEDCVVAGWCPSGNTCDPATKKCVAGCRLQADCASGATCTAGACACATGSHVCGRTCVSDASPQSCGTSCEVCPTPQNGVATCQSGACGLACDPGHLLCGGTCAPCVTPANATANCSGNACDFTCNAGFHRCGNQCIANTSVDGCGSSCTPCATAANGTASCNSNGTCSLTCDAGRRLCSGVCASCQTPANATALCSGATCDFTCNAGYHRCGNQCLADTSVNSCGSSCSACPTDTNGTAVCQNATCYLNCNTGSRKCGGVCSVCPAIPLHAQETCSSLTCDFTCDTGYHRCGNQCLANDSVDSCGTSCTPCTGSPASATVSCSFGSCSYTCSAGWLKCAGGCCRAASVSGGYALTCATTTAGEPLCWGDNFNTAGYPTPVELTTGVDELSPGAGRVCMRSATSVRCLIRGVVTTIETVQGLGTGVLAVSSGSAHSCALTSGGGVKCWGANTYGELGNGSTTASSDPVDVTGLSSGVIGISAGSFHSCAVLSSGGVKCWGNNIRGVLGDGTTTHRSTPVDVAPLGANALAVSGGNGHTCALLTGGTVKCWGRNLNGEMGNGTTSNESFTPVSVSGLTAVTEVKAGGHHTCARTMAGGLKCWGHNAQGQLGDGTTTTPRTTPVDVSGMTSGVVGFGVGDSNSCAIIGAGELLCWGDNSNSTVGDGTTIRRTTPVHVSGR